MGQPTVPGGRPPHGARHEPVPDESEEVPDDHNPPDYPQPDHVDAHDSPAQLGHLPGSFPDELTSHIRSYLPRTHRGNNPPSGFTIVFAVWFWNVCLVSFNERKAAERRREEVTVLLVKQTGGDEAVDRYFPPDIYTCIYIYTHTLVR